MLGKFFRKPEAEYGDRVPPGQHLTNGFPVLTYGDTPHVDRATWQFKVWGLAQEKTFSWSDFMNLPQSDFTADFHCVTTWSKLDVQWTGVKVTDFMQHIEVDLAAKYVLEHCYGGYTTNISIDDFLREENFFAHTLFGEPLPAEHGGPMRLVVPHIYAWKSAKWINGLEFLTHEELGFWERNGYHRRGEPWAEERYSDR
ncbi:sulfite oxidase-like oxidoreductase [Phormidesmis priestleyi ULC007]|uniref:Sulfite oxidase-like oxidoreductase n=1 Tax=Phormidesmis priestleyi ULC007 TaxID=1920490 RepID=A0A2T1DNL8_9CYAN|nr:sulfite oxidase-like oxidoreductase [Phormidesmis priestleyi]PSB22062.1 sulfite oxidase-like oxidoreductase [Phormidesmis priestleyi ULC007]PZO54970.1 MAG: sulfite oxidase-like oxidoreductase [Phormidesmis priestleyi]